MKLCYWLCQSESTQFQSWLTLMLTNMRHFKLTCSLESSLRILPKKSWLRPSIKQSATTNFNQSTSRFRRSFNSKKQPSKEWESSLWVLLVAVKLQSGRLSSKLMRSWATILLLTSWTPSLCPESNFWARWTTTPESSKMVFWLLPHVLSSKSPKRQFAGLCVMVISTPSGLNHWTL